MKKINLALVALSTAVIIGCGGGSGGNSGSSSLPNNGNTPANDAYKIIPATYTLNGSALPSCPNAYSITTLKATKEDDFGIQTCMWLCASYEGASPTSVQLSFQQQGKNSPWDFDDAVTITAPSQCHN